MFGSQISLTIGTVTLMQELWFVVAAAEGSEDAEVNGPLEVVEALDFDASGLTLHWENGEEDDQNLVVVDRYGEEINAGDPSEWAAHSDFGWRSIVVEDSVGDQWIIVVADTQAQAETAQGDLDGAVGELMFPGASRDDDDGDDDDGESLGGCAGWATEDD